jgi:hypothetical protein
MVTKSDNLCKYVCDEWKLKINVVDSSIVTGIINNSRVVFKKGRKLRRDEKC